MAGWRQWLAVAAAAASIGSIAGQPPPELVIEALSERGVFQYDESSGVASDPVGVRATYGDTTLTAKKIRFFRKSGVVEAEGDVRLRQGAELWTGDRLRYDFERRTAEASAFRFGHPPLYIAGEGLRGNFTNQIHTATNVFLTTDDVARPAHKVRAKRIRLRPGEYVEIEGATFYVGKVPIMYLPRYRRYFGRRSFNPFLVPGYRSLYGPYLLSGINWAITTNLSATAHLDYRQKRGLAGGLDLFPDLGVYGSGEASAYYASDKRPGRDARGKPIDSSRYRLRFGYKADVARGLAFHAQVQKESDAYAARDFLESEYRADREPKTFFELNRWRPNFSVNLMALPRLNDFFRTVERLPDLKVSAFRQQIGPLPVYYESESSLAYLRFREAYDARPAYEAFRGDTFHQLTAPRTFFGWLQAAPRVGVRYTRYAMGENPDRLPENQDRWVFNTGAEVSTKIWRLWPGARSRLLDADGIRHIFEPSINYVFVPDPSPPPARLPQFDYEVQTFRPLPIEYPDYNAVDAIDSQNVFRFGARNRLQTKRKDGVEDLVDWWTMIDWRVDPRPDQRTYGDLYSDLDFRPRSWITLTSELRYDLNETRWNMANHMATIEPNDRWSWQVGHRYLRRWPGLGPDSGNNLIINSVYFKLNEDWVFHIAHHFEARDGVLEEQYYTVYRDLRSWTAALTFRVRDGREEPNDFSVALTFSLKAFPRFRNDRVRPTLLLGE